MRAPHFSQEIHQVFPHCPSPAAGTSQWQLEAAATHPLLPAGLAVAAEPWSLETRVRRVTDSLTECEEH